MPHNFMAYLAQLNAVMFTWMYGWTSKDIVGKIICLFIYCPSYAQLLCTKLLFVFSIVVCNPLWNRTTIFGFNPPLRITELKHVHLFSIKLLTWEDLCCRRPGHTRRLRYQWERRESTERCTNPTTGSRVPPSHQGNSCTYQLIDVWAHWRYVIFSRECKS